MVCPACGGDTLLDIQHRDEAEVTGGRLSCQRCHAEYAVHKGVPRMRIGMDVDGIEEVADSFTHEWKAHHAGQLESDTVFGRTQEEDWQVFTDGTRIGDAELAGMRVLDVGCGSGRLTRQIAERGAALVVGADINEAVDEVFERTRDLDHLQVVQANLFALPFAPQGFDLVWSCGVIHHTPDTRAAFQALTKHVRSGGVLFVWVYPKRFNPFRYTKDALDKIGLRRLSPAAILRLSKAIAYPSVFLHRLYRGIRSIRPLRPRTEFGERTVRPRTLAEIQMTWNDALSPRFDARHTEREVVEWFLSAGYSDVSVMGEPKIGVRGVAP